jgi:hypothetical protein
MYVKWGTTQLQSRKTWLDWTYTPVFSDRGFLMWYRLNARFGGTASISGAETITDLETKMSAIQTGFLSQNKDFGLYHENNNPSVHVILAASTMDGTQMQFSWLKGTARAIRGNSNEYVNLRTYQGMVSCLIEAAEEAVPVWKETIRQVGSGDTQITIQESLTGAPAVQYVQLATQVMLIQEGHAIGWNGYPDFPGVVDPTFAPYFNAKAAIYERGTPTYGRNKTRMFPVRWRYVYEFDTAPLTPVFPTDPPALSAP